mmetsp:Transcript_21338/g.34112  ORF Transcript_21338/g.34112 Transcript_21338/m.34112 type:complete len:216 (-) Transcript_21338:135-782(-)
MFYDPRVHHLLCVKSPAWAVRRQQRHGALGGKTTTANWRLASSPTAAAFARSIVVPLHKLSGTFQKSQGFCCAAVKHVVYTHVPQSLRHTLLCDQPALTKVVSETCPSLCRDGHDSKRQKSYFLLELLDALLLQQHRLRRGDAAAAGEAVGQGHLADLCLRISSALFRLDEIRPLHQGRLGNWRNLCLAHTPKLGGSSSAWAFCYLNERRDTVLR